MVSSSLSSGRMAACLIGVMVWVVWIRWVWPCSYDEEDMRGRAIVVVVPTYAGVTGLVHQHDRRYVLLCERSTFVVCREIARRIDTIVLVTQLTPLTVVVQLTTFSPTPVDRLSRRVRTTMYVVVLFVRMTARPSPSNAPARENNISACHTTHITTTIRSIDRKRAFSQYNNQPPGYSKIIRTASCWAWCSQ